MTYKVRPWHWYNHGKRWGINWWRESGEWEFAFYVGHHSFGLAREAEA